jgi:hypothetical protein
LQHSGLVRLDNVFYANWANGSSWLNSVLFHCQKTQKGRERWYNSGVADLECSLLLVADVLLYEDSENAKPKWPSKDVVLREHCGQSLCF